MKQLTHINAKREALIAEYPQYHEDVTTLRDMVVANLEMLQKQCHETLREKGAFVYRAADAAEARQLVLDICQDAQKVCRIHSPEIAEIGFDQVMAEKNTAVVLTDLEEIIAKEAGLAAQNRHYRLMDLDALSQGDIIKALQTFVGSEDVTDEKTLATLTKQLIRSEIIASDFGVTDIDGIVAENGTLILAENEGNGRMVSNLPYRHLVIAGIDKLYDTAENAMKAIQIANIYGLGNRNASYYSLISGQSRTADIEFRMVYGMHGPLEVHVILLDNGRSALIEKGCGNLLKCIDCGACYESLQKLADTNHWQGVTLTAKNIALKATRGELGVVTALEDLEAFPCPVGITVEDLHKSIN